MCPAENDEQPLTSALAKLRFEIKECEKFVALCESIKRLEKLQDNGSLAHKKSLLESKRVNFLTQLQGVLADVARYESMLNVTKPMGMEEREHLEQLIRSGKTRARSLQIVADEATQEIAQIEQDAANNEKLAEELYAQLDEAMQSGNMHPNTVHERLESLRKEKDELSEAKRANIPRRADAQNNTNQPAPNHITPAEGVPINEQEFFKSFLHDLSSAEKSVEIISPCLSKSRAHELMPILLKLAATGKNIILHTLASNDLDSTMKTESQEIITIAHRSRITVFQRSNIEQNGAIIDGAITWEGNVNILGPSVNGTLMRRAVGSQNARELRRFLLESR